MAAWGAISTQTEPWASGPDNDFVWPRSYGQTESDQEYAEDDPGDIRDFIGYHDRPMTQADQLAYEAYMVRERAAVAKRECDAAQARFVAAAKACADEVAAVVAAWKAAMA